MDGLTYFSFWLPKKTTGEHIEEHEKEQSGVLTNSFYEEVNRTYVRNGKWLDGHEYNVLPNGKTLLLTTIWTQKIDASDLGQGEREIWNTGFREMDMETNEVLFEWIPTDGHVSLKDSCDVVGMKPNYSSKPWDWFHINSVDKNFNGDYLVSSRHTSTIYKISKDDGHVIWRLGGCGDSDFEMEEGLPFRWQHHARFRYENSTHTILSVFDNHGDDQDRNPNIPNERSAGKIIILDHTTKPMTAKMLRRFDRPDGQSSLALGSVQIIGKDPATANVFIGWAFPGYISEYDAEGRLVLEAKWMSERFRSYRAYKAQFVGTPTEPPAFKILPIAYGKGDGASAFYASWNGATEIAKWAFYGGDSLSGPLKRLALVDKHGFETSWVTPGIVKYAYAEAIGKDGKALARSATVCIQPSRDLEANYKISTPLLNDVTAHQDALFPLGAPSLADAPGVDVYAKPVPEHNAAPGTAAPSAVDSAKGNATYIVVFCFAAYGAFAVVRNVLEGIARRRQRRGYKSVAGMET